MKKGILAFVFAIFIQFSFAQEKAESPTSIIVYAGVNWASLAYNDYFYLTDANPGFSGGVVLRTDGDVYGIAGLEYVTANPTMTDRSGVTNITEVVSFELLQLPVMLGAHVLKSKDGNRTMHAQLGVNFSSLLSVSPNELGVEKSQIKNTVLTFRFGIGADLGHFTADLNYNLLISHLYDVAGYDNKALLKCWEVCVGYKFYLHKKTEE